MLQISSLLHCYTPARRPMQELQAGERSSAPSGLEVGSLNSAAQAGRPRLRPYQHTMQLDVGTWALARFVEGHVLPSTGNATLSLVAGGLCHIAAQQAKRSRPIVRRPGLGPSWGAHCMLGCARMACTATRPLGTYVCLRGLPL